jgi:hypothetical protein
MDRNQRRLMITVMLFLSFFLITAPHISARNMAAAAPVLPRKLIGREPISCSTCTAESDPRCCMGSHHPFEKSMAATDELPNTTDP